MSQQQIYRARALVTRFHARETNAARRAALSWVRIGIPAQTNDSEGSSTTLAGSSKQVITIPRLQNPFLLRPHPLAPTVAEIRQARLEKEEATASSTIDWDAVASEGSLTKSQLRKAKAKAEAEAKKAAGRKSGRSNMIPSRYSLRRQKELLKAAKLLSSLPLEQGGDPLALSKLPKSPKAVGKIVLSSGGYTRPSKSKTARLRAKAALKAAKQAPTPFTATAARAEEQGYIWVGKPQPRSTKGLKVGFKKHIWEREKDFKEANTKEQLKGMNERIKGFLGRRKGRVVGSKLPF